MRRVINEGAPRPRAELLEGFQSLLERYSPSCIVSDVMERAQTMHSSLIPVSRGRFAGPALTVKLYPGDLVDCLDALRVAQSGDVIVVDGAVRDVDEVRDLGFPLVSRAIVPRSTHSPYSKRLEPIEINVPIVCGGAIVNPGDIVLADEIGVVAVPQEEAAGVLERALAQADLEEATRQRISAGKNVDELLDEFGRL